jgi:hypothetical protein
MKEESPLWNLIRVPADRVRPQTLATLLSQDGQEIAKGLAHLPLPPDAGSFYPDPPVSLDTLLRTATTLKTGGTEYRLSKVEICSADHLRFRFEHA